MKKPRVKKFTVKPEQRNNWLKRNDAGESIADISKSAGYDVRTIRRHIEQGHQERDRRDARLTVLKDALEGHYADLCTFAEKLEAEVSREEQISLRGERIWTALRQHIPRSLLWNYLNKWDNLIQEKTTLSEKIEKRLKQSLELDAEINNILPEAQAIVPFMILVLTSQIKTWSKDYAGLNLADHLSTEDIGNGLVNLKYGSFFLNKVSVNQTSAIRSVIEKYENDVKNWDEYQAFSKLFSDIQRLRKDIDDEIAIITLRRIVPGKCLYCPL